MKSYFIVLFSAIVLSLNSQTIQFDEGHLISDNVWGAGTIYSADLDGDGDMDALSASGNQDKIAWYENDGTGNFGSQQIITTNAADAIFVHAEDLDNDGDIDVLSASDQDNKIAWYENDGNGNFGPQQIITTNTLYAYSVYAADFDGDGDNDVLSSSAFDNKIVWYENDGNGNFGPQLVITTNTDVPNYAYASDIDGDSDMDVLSASYNDNKIAWYENDGTGNFGEQQIISDQIGGADYVYTADLDGDSDMDVLFSAGGDNYIGWFENDGTGVFGNPVIISDNTDGPIEVRTGDLDGDGDIDVLSASGSDDKIAWYENDGMGNFGPQNIISTNISYAVSVFAADFTGDEALDVLCASFSDGSIYWFKNIPNGITAGLSADNTNFCESGTANFSDESTGDIISWQWAFESGNPETSTEQNPVVNYNTIGSWDVTLTVFDGTDENTIEMPDYITVNANPETTLDVFDTACLNWPSFELTGGLPFGGEYIGTGVTNNWFDPGVAGVGNHNITYSYTDENGCGNSAVQTMTVDGCTSISGTPAEIISIYPNPAIDKLIINSEYQVRAIQVIDLFGQVIVNERIDSRFYQFNTSSLKPGMFIFLIKTDHGDLSKHIVIE
jgi:PKD repeat protein